jgi:hypothetical protein
MGMDYRVRRGIARVDGKKQVVFEKSSSASEWIIKAMAISRVTMPQLSRNSGVPVMTIWNIARNKQKNGCRSDILFLLLKSCGLKLRL